MIIKSISKEEIETMSYDDIAYVILKEKGKKMKTLDLFNSVVENLGLDPKKQEEKIADFFTLLATEKRFIQLPKGFWDLKENHQIKIDIKLDDDDADIESLDDVDLIDEEEKETNYYDEKDADDDEEDDDLKDFVIIDETEETEL